jgi:hypothetical protein
VRIIGPHSAERTTVEASLVRLGASDLFVDEMFPVLWDAALSHGIDPVGVVAQSYKETGGGRFGGRVTAKFYNTAGIKVRHQDIDPALADDLPLAHAMFADWAVGAEAQVQHVAAYAGIVIDSLVVDPRYTYALKNGPEEWCENWTDLGGKWAPSPTYGVEIESLITRLRATA